MQFSNLSSVAGARFFDFAVRMFLTDVLGVRAGSVNREGFFGPTSGYYGTVEEQGRLTLHMHMLLWIAGNLNLLCRIFSRTFSVRLRPSPSVPVRSPPFYYVLPYYSVLLCPLLSHPRPYYVSVLSVPSFQLSTLGSDLFSVSSDLASYYFHYCSAITPISQTPSHPVLLLTSVLYCLMIRTSLLFRYV